MMKHFLSSFTLPESYSKPVASSPGTLSAKRPGTAALPTRRVLLELSREPKFLDGSHDVFDLLASYSPEVTDRTSV